MGCSVCLPRSSQERIPFGTRPKFGGLSFQFVGKGFQSIRKGQSVLECGSPINDTAGARFPNCAKRLPHDLGAGCILAFAAAGITGSHKCRWLACAEDAGDRDDASLNALAVEAPLKKHGKRQLVENPLLD
jgi:hypothetical protein